MHRPWALPGLVLSCSLLLSPLLVDTPAAANPPTEFSLNSSALELPHARSIDPVVGELFPRWTSVRIYLNAEHAGDSDIAELTAWARSLRERPLTQRLRAINERVNRILTYSTDLTLWDETDYWETPGEAVGRGAADCEGYAILKMYLAKEAGIALEQMAILVGALGPRREPHAILGAKVGQIVVTLDNKTGSIVTLRDRSDFTPVYSVGVRGAFTYPLNWSASAGEPSRDTPAAQFVADSVTGADSNAHSMLRPASAAAADDAAKDDPAAATVVTDDSEPLPAATAAEPQPAAVASQDAPAIQKPAKQDKNKDLFASDFNGTLDQVVTLLLR
ncbi:MAG TPA: transglutaminase-like cysteine peptidase [Dongiaceae bacterium]|jgi:predicted transglutaminase-like cysteine proteinase